MAYSQNFEKSARRHLKAAQILYDQDGAGNQPGCMAVAGYLFGIAGELAVKQVMRKSGIALLPEANRRDDPYYAHFPALKTMLSTSAGRLAGALRPFSEDTRLFQNWDTAMRYAPTSDVKKTWVDAWKDSAERLVQAMAKL